MIDAGKLLGLPFELSFTKGEVIALSTFIMSVQYNVGNFWIGFQAAENKVHALFCMLPFFQVCGILTLASQYSQFWYSHNAFFIFGVGMLITSMTGNLNLKSCA